MPGASGEPSLDDQLKQALKAFKKRLKLTRLDHESKMGYGPTSTGRSPIVGIMPPSQFPQSIWNLLAQQGKIKHVGEGVYELIGS